MTWRFLSDFMIREKFYSNCFVKLHSSVSAYTIKTLLEVVKVTGLFIGNYFLKKNIENCLLTIKTLLRVKLMVLVCLLTRSNIWSICAQHCTLICTISHSNATFWELYSLLFRLRSKMAAASPWRTGQKFLVTANFKDGHKVLLWTIHPVHLTCL